MPETNCQSPGYFISNDYYLCAGGAQGMGKAPPDLNDPSYRFAFLLYEVAALMRRKFRAAAPTIGLTQDQARALSLIAMREGETQVSLARRLDMHPMTFARLLDRMAKAGTIERRRDPRDRRVYGVFLAPGALPALSKMLEMAADLRDLMISGFAATEEDLLVRYLLRLKGNLVEDTEAAQTPARSRTRSVA